jgi:putative transposase
VLGETPRKAVFGGVPWQRCHFHLEQNAQAFVPRQEMKREVAAAIRAIFNASRGEAVLRILVILRCSAS